MLTQFLHLSLMLALTMVTRADNFEGFVEGFYIDDVVVPEGCTYRAREGDLMHQDYTGYLDDGTVFDSSYSRGNTFDFHLGMKEVIAGIDMGMKGMCKGEKRTITIPPEMGYGQREVGSIPPGSTLKFEVVLTDITPSGFQIELLHMPDNCTRRSAAGDFIREHYNGTLEDGSIFDTSYSRGKTYDFTLGEDQVIKGVDMGLINMCQGEKRRLTIPAILAYGSQGYDDIIPSDATIIFEVELVEIVQGKLKYHKMDGPECPEEERCASGDQVTVTYNGFAENGYQFSSQGKEVSLTVGTEGLLHGLTHGLHGMCTGERRRIRIPPEFAYGDIDNDNLPQGVRLTLDIELVDMAKSDMFKTIDVNGDRYLGFKEVEDWIMRNPDFEELLKEESYKDKLLDFYYHKRDKDTNGWVSRNEFYGIKVTHDEL